MVFNVVGETNVMYGEPSWLSNKQYTNVLIENNNSNDSFLDDTHGEPSCVGNDNDNDFLDSSLCTDFLIENDIDSTQYTNFVTDDNICVVRELLSTLPNEMESEIVKGKQCYWLNIQWKTKPGENKDQLNENVGYIAIKLENDKYSNIVLSVTINKSDTSFDPEMDGYLADINSFVEFTIMDVYVVCMNMRKIIMEYIVQFHTKYLKDYENY